MKLFWLSWEDCADDYRPLTDPPNASILGWWNTGTGGGYVTICALVKAEDSDGARAAVIRDWPEAAASNWRFCTERDSAELGSRFPIESAWMRDRVDAWKAGER